MKKFYIPYIVFCFVVLTLIIFPYKNISKPIIEEKTQKTYTVKAKNNKILSFARGLNSVPGIVTTFLISPYVLGWFIPRLTYANTRRLHEKAAQERAEIEKSKSQA